MTSHTRRLHLDLDQQATDRYLKVPFDVSGSAGVEVTLAYQDHEAVIDLGCEGPLAFRGWSGGARKRFAITEGRATPGYVPGALEDGTWNVLLGLHQLPQEGVDVELTIVTHTDPREANVEADPPAPPPVANSRASNRNLPAASGLKWFAGDFHSHSLHSDGALSLSELAHQAASATLDFLAVTDHNTVSHHRHLPGVSDAYDITLLAGQEITTHRGHANAFGEIGWIDFREPADNWVAEVAERGGIMSINHPISGDCSWLHPLTVIPPALELWHVTWFRDLTSTAPWSLWQHWQNGTTLLGGSDFHNHSNHYLPGTPTTWVAAVDRSPEAILDGVRAGRTAISVLPGPNVPILLRIEDQLVAVDADGTVLVDIEGRRRVIRGDHVTFAADSTASSAGSVGAGVGPYRLETARRDLVAISA